MFAYCANNPVKYTDESGEAHTQGTDGASVSTKDYIFEVYKEKYFAVYKSALVIRHSSEFLTSWSIGGVIFLNHNLDYEPYSYRKAYLDHEYGHILQERIMGTPDYLWKIVVPSVLFNLISRGKNSVGRIIHKLYYFLPWEYTANILGGAKIKDLL